MTRFLYLVLAVAIMFMSTVRAKAQPPETRQLQFSKWSGDINVPDPVAIGFDERGRAYVTQTQRRKSQDLDIRANRSWIPDDVGFETVQDKLDFYRRELAPGDDEENSQHVQDMNKDGRHDYRDLTVLSELVHRLEDKDGDGTADSMKTFAAGFQTEVTGIAAGVMHHEGDVYATIAPDVWKLRDTNKDGEADQREKLATGFGLHIAYAGHDMHGLTVGPDGKIYWSVGDKGISATSREGERFHFPNQGGVMRCNPDGSGFEVFAHGLRNVQELAFDQWGNLFGVDNDADKQGERERFVYIVKGMDAGWRCNYQYRGSNYDPWMAEGLWRPWHEGQPAYIVPPISHSIDGPAGFAFNPGSALSPAYRDYFFLTGAPNGNQIAFRVEPDRASFRMVDEHRVGSGVPLVGINFGPDGGLYGVDWGGGYPLNQSGAVWKIDDPEFSKSTLRREVAEMLAKGFREAGTDELLNLLSHVDQRIRLGAQFELVKRNACDEFFGVSVNSRQEILARVHAIWGLGQLARSGDDEAILSLSAILSRVDEPELVAQVARCAGDLPAGKATWLASMMMHASPRVRFMAALALADQPTKRAVRFFDDFAARTEMSETYSRFALARAMSACATEEQLVGFKDHRDDVLRMAAVVALRFQKSERVADFLASQTDDAVTEAARAIHDDFSILAALPVLADALMTSRCDHEAFVRRAINANLRIGTPRNAKTLVDYATDRGRPVAMRHDALNALARWVNPDPLDRVTGRYRPRVSSERTFDHASLAEKLSPLLSDESNRIRVAALEVASSLGIRVADVGLERIVRSGSTDPSVRMTALGLLERQRATGLEQVAKDLIDDDVSEMRTHALRLVAARDGSLAEEVIAKVMESSRPVAERQAAIQILGTLESETAKSRLKEFLRLAKAGTESLQDVYLELVKATGTELSDTYVECLLGGDRKKGRDLFMTHLGAQCVRCHRIGKQGSDVGPPLDSIASRRDRAHLLRAIVRPSVDIDEKYRMHTLVLTSGKTLQGVIVERNEKSTSIRNASGEVTVVPEEDIDESLEQQVSLMPEMKEVLTSEEIRDLVAWLVTLQGR